MLQLKDICKKYVTGDLEQTALDHVSLSLRDNEFVAILGPSGSGKTTMLNIIGGLDRYDSGDLIINDISTRKYKDRDWDSYRNHTVGFVFQSYNLIPHQTILSNVELALTISGVSAGERSRRAKEALEKVGLGEQVHKKPNQLSGGQMQRVAIARALVNDPDILLADEPTGALDTETSVQVMDLLKEVASDRLVVMVTHNPELAEDYATRIVRLKDGKIISDSDPYTINEEPTRSDNLGKSSMSLLTSLALSFNNLRTKKARTFLVAFAGSIGIIGIALILSLSNGVNDYIRSIEEDTLSEYPIAIQTNAVSLAQIAERTDTTEVDSDDKVLERRTITRMFSGLNTNDLISLRNYLESGKSDVDNYTKAIEYSWSITPEIWQIYNGEARQVNPDKTFSSMGLGYSGGSSTLSAFMSTDTFHPIPDNEELYINQYEVKAGHWPENFNECVLVLSPTGRVTDYTLYTMGLRDPSEITDMLKEFSETDSVTVDDTSLMTFDYEDFLNVSFNLVSSADRYVYDEEFKVYKDKSEDRKFMKSLVENGTPIRIVGVVKPKDTEGAAMLMSGIGYPSSLIDHIVKDAADSEIVRAQLKDPDVNVITGKRFDDVQREGFDMSKMFSVDEKALQNAFNFDMSSLNNNFSGIDLSNVFDPSGLNFDLPEMNMDLSSILTSLHFDINAEEIFSLAESVVRGYADESSKNEKTDWAKLGESFFEYVRTEEGRTVLNEKLSTLIEESGVTSLDPEVFRNALASVMSGYPEWLVKHEIPTVDPNVYAEYLDDYLNSEEAQALISEALGTVREELGKVEFTQEQLETFGTSLNEAYTAYAKEKGNIPDPSLFTQSVNDYLAKESTQKTMTEGISKAVNADDLSAQINSLVNAQVGGFAAAMQSSIANAVQNMMSQMASGLTSAISSRLSRLTNLSNTFKVDANAFSEAIKVTMSEEDMQALMSSMMSTNQYSYDSNLRNFGYADLNKPYSISIYPKDFESKSEILKILDQYNAAMREEDPDKVIEYTDVVGTLMSGVTNIVNTVSYVLIAFVAVSLIVSSIMIGIITYISVLERIKEIGILRAIGASKRNISEVFNAETFIIGLLSGLLGIGITYLLLIPINAVIHNLTDNYAINAFLPAENAVILVVISVILTLIGGLIPSRQAAQKDPVIALRSE
ncbi:MAG: ABC transporter ATP-binding protein/permease [Erysipelotrichaceae bacterium]|nr:ABC transporter ATP-binding protein/permease [Erysipelotrichaceae bacterium]